MSHQDKVIVLTHAARGFGRILAEWFLELGAKVVVSDPHRNHLDALKHEHAKSKPHYHARAHYQHCDVGNEASVRSLVASTVETFTVIDVVIFYAPVSDGHRAAGECETDHWHRVMSTGCHGPYHLAKHALPHMQKQCKARSGKNGGLFINLCSTAGIKGAAAGAACTASQHAMIGLTQNTASSYGHEGIYAVSGVLGKMRETVIEEVVVATKERIDISLRIYSEESFVEEYAAAKHIASICEGDNGKMLNGSTINMCGNWPAC
ncbi:putative oxidoreductase [Escovopsis weberi]|uniref:Putative oxidoreductase n=1 Tax=Escovopsis weberi TaxID=150374 RepID=A0A0M9VTX0_ESCWE|nr:putative oxidoreductase [Escovopsis weberi]